MTVETKRSLLKNIEKWFSRLEENFTGGILLFSGILLFINVIMRYVFHHAIFWAEELVRYGMVWLIFIGGSQVIKKEGHIRVDLIHVILPDKGQKLLNIVIDTMSLVFCLGLTFYGFQQTMRIKHFEQVSAALELSMWVVYLSIPLGGVLMSFRYIQRLITAYKTGLL